MSAPRTITEPEVGVSRPRRIDRVVVLPAPLPPSSAVVEPAATVKLTSSTAVMASKRLLSRCTTIACAGVIARIILPACAPGCFAAGKRPRVLMSVRRKSAARTGFDSGTTRPLSSLRYRRLAMR